MSGPPVGFFGKLPSNGDFVERRVPDAFHEVWDAWLQRSLTESREELGSRWLDCYLTSPMWRFFLSDGVAGSASYAGVLLPSVDRVGRYFPLTVVVELPVGLRPLRFARRAAAWFSEVERLCTGMFEDGNTQLEDFDGTLAASVTKLGWLDELAHGVTFPGSASQWHWPVRSLDQLADTLVDPLMSAAQTALRPLTLWWTAGSELVQPCVLISKALPRPDSFAALLSGSWDDGRWEGAARLELDTEEPVPVGAAADMTIGTEMSFVTTSAGATDVGAERHENQDALLLNEDNRLWAVADGMGAHRQGGVVASQMVVDALNALEPTASLSATLHAVGESLTRLNADLRRHALGFGADAVSGSTVVTLFIRGGEWGVAWAGDSRAYRFRDGALTRLTRDHRATFEPDETVSAILWPDESAAWPGNLEIPRAVGAVGAEEEFELDQVSDLIADGDRFLLCSDGLYDALDSASIAHIIAQGTPEEATRALIAAARVAGARDNVTAVIVDARADGPGWSRS